MPPRRLRILHVIKGLASGGAETLLVQGPAVFGDPDFEYGVAYYLEQHDQLKTELERRGVQTVCLGARSVTGMIPAAFRLARLIRSFRPQVIHTHLPLAAAVTRPVALAFGIPCVGTEHSLRSLYRPVTRVLNDLTFPLQAQSIACSKAVLGSFDEVGPSSVPRRVVMNGIDETTFRRNELEGRQIRQQLGIPADAPVVGQVAGFRHAKRLDRWMEVAARVLERRSDVHFMIVGDGELRSSVEESIRHHGLGARVHLTGRRSDVSACLSAMDVLLMTSDFEGLPLALLEAMSCGVVPVVTDVGGNREVVEEGTSGFLAAREDVQGLAALVLQALEPQNRERMSAAARERVLERFTIRHMVGELEEIYLALANSSMGD